VEFYNARDAPVDGDLSRSKYTERSSSVTSEVNQKYLFFQCMETYYPFFIVADQLLKFGQFQDAAEQSNRLFSVGFQ